MDGAWLQALRALQETLPRGESTQRSLEFAHPASATCAATQAALAALSSQIDSNKGFHPSVVMTRCVAAALASPAVNTATTLHVALKHTAAPAAVLAALVDSTAHGVPDTAVRACVRALPPPLHSPLADWLRHVRGAAAPPAEQRAVQPFLFALLHAAATGHLPPSLAEHVCAALAACTTDSAISKGATPQLEDVLAVCLVNPPRTDTSAAAAILQLVHVWTATADVELRAMACRLAAATADAIVASALAPTNSPPSLPTLASALAAADGIVVGACQRAAARPHSLTLLGATALAAEGPSQRATLLRAAVTAGRVLTGEVGSAASVREAFLHAVLAPVAVRFPVAMEVATAEVLSLCESLCHRRTDATSSASCAQQLGMEGDREGPAVVLQALAGLVRGTGLVAAAVKRGLAAALDALAAVALICPIHRTVRPHSDEDRRHGDGARC